MANTLCHVWTLWTFVNTILHTTRCAALSGPVVGEQEVSVFADETEFEVPERAAGTAECPDAHQEQQDVGGNQSGDVLGVLEGLLEKMRNRNKHKRVWAYSYLLPLNPVWLCVISHVSVIFGGKFDQWPFDFLTLWDEHYLLNTVTIFSSTKTLTRQEMTRWLVTTIATAHQRFFSQASKKTTPQNMWRRMMAMVMKAGEDKNRGQGSVKCISSDPCQSHPFSTLVIDYLNFPEDPVTTSRRWKVSRNS